MQHPKQTIQLSEHIKNKLRQHQPTPLSLSSDDLTLSENSDDDVFLTSATPEKSLRRRSSTFVTYALRPPSQSQSLQSLQRVNAKPTSSLAVPQPSCQECRRRDNFLRNEHERLVHVYNENRKLTEQLRSAAIVNHHYQEENAKLKLHLSKVSTHLKEYQMNFDLLKQQLAAERTSRSQQSVPANQLQRLRRELHVYNEVVAAKKEEEQDEIAYYSYRKWMDRN